MYKLSYDLHIHSCLSPCGDDSSTPGDIARLASVLELDTVALTDHNSTKNCPAFFAAAKECGIIPIAGMELTTEEEIHVLCLFPELENAMDFDKIVYEKLLPIKNDPDIFGNQFVMDENDKVLDTVEKCLINAVSIDIYSLGGIVSEHGGIIIPAHIDRSSFSLTASLGFVPDDCSFDVVEIYNQSITEQLKEKYEYVGKCKIVHNSDAHRLENINLPINFIDVEEKTAAGILRALT